MARTKQTVQRNFPSAKAQPVAVAGASTPIMVSSGSSKSSKSDNSKKRKRNNTKQSSTKTKRVRTKASSTKPKSRRSNSQPEPIMIESSSISDQSQPLTIPISNESNSGDIGHPAAGTVLQNSGDIGHPALIGKAPDYYSGTVGHPASLNKAPDYYTGRVGHPGATTRKTHKNPITILPPYTRSEAVQQQISDRNAMLQGRTNMIAATQPASVINPYGTMTKSLNRYSREEMSRAMDL